jgi:vitamin B12 transporter
MCGAVSFLAFARRTSDRRKRKGWEANARLVLAEGLPFIKLLDLQGQYTYTLTRDLETGDRLPRWPVHQGSLVLTYQPYEPLMLTASFRYVGSRFNTTGNQQPLPAFHVLNLAASYNVHPVDSRLCARGECAESGLRGNFVFWHTGAVRVWRGPSQF